MGTENIPAPSEQLKPLDVAKCAARSFGCVVGAFLIIGAICTVLQNFTNILDALAINVWSNLVIAGVLLSVGGTTACVGVRLPKGNLVQRRISTFGAVLQIGTVMFVAAISRLPDDDFKGWYMGLMAIFLVFGALIVGTLNGERMGSEEASGNKPSHNAE